MDDVQTSNPGRLLNRTYHVLGAAALAVNKLRYALLGYRGGRGFRPSAIQRGVQYDLQVLENWLRYLGEYLGRLPEIGGRNVLELGPGRDLGVGLILLAAGARRYNALDAHNLLGRTPQQFYESLLERLEKDGCKRATLEELVRQLGRTRSGRPDRLNYLCRADFDLSVFAGEVVDFVFSQAVFEHLDDVGKTVNQLSRLVRPGGLFLGVIDLQTHTRWLRSRDPLNIYRYSDSFWRLCKYAGQPNRIRPFEYRQVLAANGWRDIRILPLEVLDSGYLRRVQPALNERFRTDGCQMEYLTVVICATKA